jgi:hypothetical protein
MDLPNPRRADGVAPSLLQPRSFGFSSRLRPVWFSSQFCFIGHLTWLSPGRSAAMTTVLDPPTPEVTLSASPLPELRRLVVHTSEQEVVITGRVSSYYMKQLAQESVRCAIGCRKLLNRVVVAQR